MPIKDLTGHVFGRLTVESLHSIKDGKPMWCCKCECGNRAVVIRNSLTGGRTKSCGCLQTDTRREPKTHGMKRTLIYGVWCSMIARCHRTSSRDYHRYGARGITVHPWWREFMNFFVDMGNPLPGQKLDRIDGTKGYGPSNCRWVTNQQNAMNSLKHASTASRFKGVCRSGAKWMAKIKLNGKEKYLGTFTLEEEAARAYDEAARELFGEFACCNFEQEAADA